MILHRLTFTEYELPLRVPFKTSRGSMHTRRGFLVAVHGESSTVGVGEVAPLPEFSTETIERAREILERLASKIPSTVPDHYSEFPLWHRAADLDENETPATVFGVDCALAGAALMLSRRGKRPQPAAQELIPVNSLLQGESAEQLLASARYFFAQRFTTVKLKVGVLPVADEISLVKRICCELPKLKLRVDANGVWTQMQALEFCAAMQGCDVEYIEDPVARGDEATLIRLRDECPVRVGLDDFWPPRLIAADKINWSLMNVLVLKPVRVGSLARIERIEKRAQEHGVDVVFTSMMESSLGIACTMGFLPPAQKISLAQGLDTARWLEADTLVEPLISKHGKLRPFDVTSLPNRIREPYRSALEIR